uniref:Uncharacterized protein n=1 Tax=Neocamarosporium betae TaxID=1979465 RepID=A0A0C6DRT8_NEOBT|nr:hypothetical protein [Neocamarosporium betae]
MAEPVFQFAASERELELHRTIRRMDRSLSAAQLEQTRFNQILTVSIADANGHVLGNVEIDARDLVWESVRMAVGIHEELTKDNSHSPPEPGEVVEDAQSGGRDSVFGTQSQASSDDIPDETLEETAISWDAIQTTVIPPFVKEVTFTIDQNDMTSTTQEEMQVQFPGVVIQTDGTNAEKEKALLERPQEKPRGIKRMIIELDETEVAQDPRLDNTMREKFPWALIESKPEPNTSRKRASRATETDNTLRRVDPLRHLEDFADYAVEPPLDDEFGYNYPVGESWDKLGYPKKLEIAHARAIQHQHGKPADGPGCSHCVAEGYQCKTYLPQLANLSHITFGHSCQNCRLKGISCDLPAAMRERHPQTPATRPSTLKLDTQNLPLDSPVGDDTPAPSTAATPKPSLLSRMSRGDSMSTPTNPFAATPKPSLLSRISRGDSMSTPTNPFAATTQTQDDNAVLDPATCQSIHDSEMMVEDVVKEINLKLPEDKFKALGVIKAIYNHWRKFGEIKPFVLLNHRASQTYYGNMIALYIVAYAKMDMPMAYATLLRIQSTVLCFKDALPHLEHVIQAFEYLPYNSPLCQWLATLYAFDSNWVKVGDHHRFITSRLGFNHSISVAVAKLFYVIASLRSPYIEDLEDPILNHWCMVHDHDQNSKDLCERTRYGDIEDEVLISSRVKWKRKMDASPLGNFKKNKRGGSFGHNSSANTEPADAETSDTLLPNFNGNSTRMSTTQEQQASSLFTPDVGDEDEHPVDAIPSVEQEDSDGPASPQCLISLTRAQALYNHWLKKKNLPIKTASKKLPPHISTAFPPNSSLTRPDRMYEDLLDLFVYAQHADVNAAFEQAVLKKWQECDYPKHNASVPDLSIVAKAFNLLPVDHVLLRYLVRFMGARWATHQMSFIEEYKPFGPGFERFLYGISWIRALGNIYRDDIALHHWCECHTHASEAEKEACEAWRDSLVNKGWKENHEKSVRDQLNKQLSMKSGSYARMPVVSRDWKVVSTPIDTRIKAKPACEQEPREAHRKDQGIEEVNTNAQEDSNYTARSAKARGKDRATANVSTATAHDTHDDTENTVNAGLRTPVRSPNQGAIVLSSREESNNDSEKEYGDDVVHDVLVEFCEIC